jgi:alpha-L-arabinofuranosidase
LEQGINTLQGNRIDTLLAPMLATSYRFPGGSLANTQEAIGPLSGRGGTGSRFAFGTAEFVALCRRVGAEPVITVNCSANAATAA